MEIKHWKYIIWNVVAPWNPRQKSLSHGWLVLRLMIIFKQKKWLCVMIQATVNPASMSEINIWTKWNIPRWDVHKNKPKILEWRFSQRLPRFFNHGSLFRFLFISNAFISIFPVVFRKLRRHRYQNISIWILLEVEKSRSICTSFSSRSWSLAPCFVRCEIYLM